MRNKPDSLSRLQAAGINYEDACALRRIAMTLHRWHELECGDGDEYASWCITRGKWEKANPPPKLPAPPHAFVQFTHCDAGTPFIERHNHNENFARYTSIPDRERGALKRLAAIMARYPDWESFVQGDPRGCALYIIRKSDIVGQIDSCYSRGIAVHK